MCCHNLRRIGKALQCYHDEFGSFPPAAVVDKQGRPLYSWRVLLLPYLDEAELYARYRLDEPWDGPNNRLLHGAPVDVFTCPDDEAATSSRPTSFLVVAGPETCWPLDGGSQTVAHNSIPDGPDQTVLVIEAHGTGIHWMAPDNLSLAELTGAGWPPMGKPARHKHRKSYLTSTGPMSHALLADGSVLKVRSGVDAVDMRPLLTRAAGDDASSVLSTWCERYP
ncbi:MAG: DUF1559 domain-containing protein [Pirellulales bacterium]|nr:DUF1559 domain-containing protein [Pirellulales bacterium]